MPGNDDWVDVRLPREKYDAWKRLVPDLDADPAANPRFSQWSLEEFEEWMLPRMAVSTADKRKRIVRFLMAHPEHPVQLKPPSEASYLEHIGRRKKAGDLEAPAMVQYRRALLSLFEFLDFPKWRYLDKPPSGTHKVKRVCPDHLVPRFWNEFPWPYPKARAILEHIAFLGFHVGLRPPTEYTLLRLDDIEWDARSMVVRTAKKHGETRVVEGIPQRIFNARDEKSLWHYVENVRARSNSGRVFVNTAGKPLSPNHLSKRLSDAGKQIWPGFRAYGMRHWCLTSMLIQTDFNFYRVSQVAGNTPAVLQYHYLDVAKARAAIREGRHEEMWPSL